MKDFSVIMALVDFVPVLFFATAAVILMRDLHNKMSKGIFALFAAGSINIICAGALKATYKLLYAAGICDFNALSAMFFPLQSMGFLLAGIGAVAMLCHKQGRTYVLASVPPVFSGTFLFVGLMVLGLGLMNAVLCVLAAKLKKPALIILFMISFASSLGMGYLSGQDFTQAFMNWLAEGINVAGQGALLLAVWLLRKNGLADLKLRNGEKA